MDLGRRISIREKAVLDHHYKADFETRISALESVRQQTFVFTAEASQTSLELPFPAKTGFTPIVALGGVLQAWGRDYTTPSATEVLFSESLIEGDIITVILTYQEA